MIKINSPFYGNITVIENDKTISNWIREGYIWEEDTVLDAFIKYYKGGNVIDCGAYIGLHSIAFRKYTKTNKIYSFEAHPETYRILRGNTCKLLNINSFNIALSDHKGKKYIADELFTRENPGGLSVSDTEGDIEVYCNTLDSFNISNVGFIKIDVEGNEGEVLKGAIKTIETYKPTICCEILGGVGRKTYNTKQKKYVDGIIKMITDMDYKNWKAISPHDYLFWN